MIKFKTFGAKLLRDNIVSYNESCSSNIKVGEQRYNINLGVIRFKNGKKPGQWKNTKY